MDPVRLRLKTLDSQLASPHPIDACSKRIPLLLPVLSLILGILIESLLQWHRFTWLGLFISGAFILICRGTHRFFALACVMMFVLGGLRLACYTQLPYTEISLGITEQDMPATVTGRISTCPKLVETDWHYASQLPAKPGQSFDLRVEGQVSGTIRVYVTEPVPGLSIGTRITLNGRLGRFKPAPNPGQFDVATHMARKNCFVTAFVKSPLSIKILPDSPHLWFRVLRARSHLQQRIAESFVVHGQDTTAKSALLQALLLGVRTDVPSTTLQAFQTTGLLHLISLSGLHVGILLSMIWAIGQCMGLLKPARSFLCLCVLAGFLWLVPLRAATVRAGLIAGLFCVAVFFKRRPQPVNTLSLAALILLLLRPTQVFEVGWQLSFSSVLGILLISSSVNTWLRQRFLKRWPAPKRILWRIIHHGLRSALTLLAVGLGAWLGSAALLAYHFFSITPLSVLYTIIALPLVTLILMVGFVHILAVLFCSLISPITLFILNGLASSLLFTVHGLGLIPGSRILLGYISQMPVILYYGLLLSGLLCRKRLTGWILIGLALILPLAWDQSLKLWQNRTPFLELTCLSVGHGQALVLHTADSHTFIFDAGSLYQKDIGRRIVSAFLDYRGISDVDAIVASHNDADHVNGIPEIIEHCVVDHVYAPAIMVEQAQGDQGPGPWLQQYLQTTRRTLEPLPRTLSPHPGLFIQQLWPDFNTVTSQLSDNNASLVLVITYGDHTILLTSDIEQSTQRRVVELYPDLQPDILMAPHHGSLTTLSDNFLTHLAPKTILCSCGTSQFQRNRVISTLTTLHTPKYGAITLTLNDQGATWSTLIDNGI